MAKFTYEDFENALNESGLGSQFSAADMKLAQKNPDAGMSILNYKKDYASATTDEERAIANKGAENVRASFGEYTGGKDGSGFYATQLSPNHFEYGSAPTYNNQYAGTIQDLLNQQLNYGDYSYSGEKPTYTNRYDAQIQDLLNQQLNYGEFTFDGEKPVYENRYDAQIQDKLNSILNREEFSYDPSTDPLYSQYAKQYAREGQRATANALAEAAAASGGQVSSWAQTAAGQAGNYYASQMTDKIPELWELAYQKYMNDENLKYSDLAALQGVERSDYDKFLNELGQYNADRNFEYGLWSDAYNRIVNNLGTVSGLEQNDFSKYLAELDQFNIDRSFDYNVWSDAYDRIVTNLGAVSGLEQNDYAKYQDQLNQYNTDRNFEYGKLLDEIDSQTLERNEALDKAILAGTYGDYSYLNDMGINTDNVSGITDWEKQFALAEAIAQQTGDYSYLYQLAAQMR